MTYLKPITRRSARGFTIVELLVVIAIIAIIASLLLASGTLLWGSARNSQARSVLAGLSGLSGQYEVQTRYRLEHLASASSIISWGGTKTKNSPLHQGQTGLMTGGFDYLASEHASLYEVDSSHPDYSDYKDNREYMELANLYSERFVWAAYKVPAIRNSITSFGDQLADSDNDGFLDLTDPWGNPIAYASNVRHGAAYNKEDDFLPQHTDPFFASAGADGLWGQPQTRSEFPTGPSGDSQYQSYKKTNDYLFSVDNLYSFDLDQAAGGKED